MSLGGRGAGSRSLRSSRRDVHCPRALCLAIQPARRRAMPVRRASARSATILRCISWWGGNACAEHGVGAVAVNAQLWNRSLTRTCQLRASWKWGLSTEVLTIGPRPDDHDAAAGTRAHELRRNLGRAGVDLDGLHVARVDAVEIEERHLTGR